MHKGLTSLWRHRELIGELTRRELQDRHAGSALGICWVFLHPIIQLAVYTVVFTQIFKVKFESGADLPFSYTVYVFAGFLPWVAVSEAVLKSAVSITANASLVKQVVFPTEVLPVKSTIAALVTQLVGLVVAAILTGLTEGRIPVTYLLLPLVLGLEVALLLGIGWGVAAIGTFFRDAREVLQVVLWIGVYCIPAFYLEAWVPDALRPVIRWNPFTHLIHAFQDAMYYGRFAHPWSWVILLVLSPAAFLCGHAVFARSKTRFATVL